VRIAADGTEARIDSPVPRKQLCRPCHMTILMRLKFVVVPGVLGSVSAQLLRRKEARLAKKSGEQPNEPRGSVSPVAAA